MKASFVTCGFTILGCLTGLVGCQDASTYTAEKPVLDPDPAAQVKMAIEKAGEGLSEAVDAVMPDNSIVDVETPLGDVKVGRDPATGGTNVAVDSNRADIDVSTDE